jgi:hypothetical protein
MQLTKAGTPAIATKGALAQPMALYRDFDVTPALHGLALDSLGCPVSGVFSLRRAYRVLDRGRRGG